MGFSEEFSRLYSGNKCSVENTDWTQPQFFDSSNPCYEAEAALVSSLTTEAYSNFGFEVQYFIKDISTNKDVVFGEDRIENIVRRFTLHMYAESLPQFQKLYQLQGMTYTEIIQVQCSIQEFYNQSQKPFEGDETSHYDPEIPRIGDIVYLPFCDLYYEVVNVKTFAEGSSFLSEPITYTFHLKIWHNDHENIDENNTNSDEMEHLSSYINLSSTFNVDTKVQEIEAKDDILAANDYIQEREMNNNYQDPNMSDNSLDPFSGW